MQILVVFFLAALVGCYDDESGCLERTKSCVADLIEITEIDFSFDYKFCKKLIKSIECLEKAVVQSCAGDELEDEWKLDIEQMKKDKNEFCSIQNVTPSHNDEIERCLKENDGYALQCFSISYAEVLDALADQSGDGGIDDRAECAMYERINTCAKRRIWDKCGAEAALRTWAQMNDVPDGVKEACESVDILPLRRRK